MPDYRTITIDGRPIGAGHPPYVVAEVSANHLGRIDNALALIREAKRVGADAVKLQTYTADTLTLDSDHPSFKIKGGLWDGRTLYELYEEAHTPWEWHEALFAEARKAGITVFSSPFDPTAVAFLEKLGAPAYKVASPEVIDLPLIELMAATGKPLIISTGMADLQEIEAAVTTVRNAGAGEIALLHCVSGYPTPVGESNLRTLTDLADRFGTVPGLSDHSLGVNVAITAVALGARVIEKHFTKSRAEGGPDSAFSLEPDEFQALTTGCRQAFDALGEAGYGVKPSEKVTRLFRRSLYAVRDIAAGEALTAANVRSIRPGDGLPPKDLPKVLKSKARIAIARGTPLRWDMIE
jgi:pseudaminic acid synthase